MNLVLKANIIPKSKHILHLFIIEEVFFLTILFYNMRNNFPFLNKSSLFDFFFQVLIEQLTSSPLNNLLFMIYYGLVIEG